MKKAALFGGLALMVLLGAGCANSAPTLLYGSQMIGAGEVNQGMVPSPDGQSAILLVATKDTDIIKLIVLKRDGSSWKEVDQEAIEGDTIHLSYSTVRWIDDTKFFFQRITQDEGGYHAKAYTKIAGQPAVELPN